VEAFETLKGMLCSAPILVASNLSDEFIVTTDTSNDFICAYT
jgi:hypothetical protein